MDAQTLALIHAAAGKYDLPPRLVEAIVMVESGGRAKVQRYEPGFFARYIEGKNLPLFGVSRETEERQRATSYGLMQVMGETARELGLKAPAIERALSDPATNLDYGCRLLARHAKRYRDRADAWPAVCAAYNGGAGAVRGVGIYNNPEYPAKVAYWLGKLGVRLDDNWSELDQEVA